MTDKPDPDPAPRLASLRATLDRLGAMPLSPEAQGLVAAAVRDARAAADLFAERTPWFVDRGVFDGLLRLAGAQIAPDLLRQLDGDLAGVETALGTALAQDDRAALRAQSHIVLALAGSVGAVPLHAAAGRLNRAAQDESETAEDAKDVLAGLADLREFLKAAQSPFATEGPV